MTDSRIRRSSGTTEAAGLVLVPSGRASSTIVAGSSAAGRDDGLLMPTPRMLASVIWRARGKPADTAASSCDRADAPGETLVSRGDPAGRAAGLILWGVRAGVKPLARVASCRESSLGPVPPPTLAGVPVRRLVVLAFIWGWSFLFIKVIVDHSSPQFVAWGRVTLGLAVVLAFLYGGGERFPERRWWGHLAVLAGVAVVAGFAGGDLAGSSFTGTLGVVAGSAGYGFGFAYAHRFVEGLSPIRLAAGQLAASALLLTPGTTVELALGRVQFTPLVALCLLLLGALGTGYAYVLNYRILKDVGGTGASLVTYLIPIVGVGAGILVLHEPFSLRQVAGALVIIFGIALVQGRLIGPSPSRRRASPCHQSRTAAPHAETGAERTGRPGNLLASCKLPRSGAGTERGVAV